MALSSVVLELVLVVATMLVTAALVIVGPRPIRRALGDVRWRIGAIALPATALIGVLTVRWGTDDVIYDLTWEVLGTDITQLIYNLEGAVFPTNPVIFLQSFQSPALTTVFVFVYIYGYAFLLAFPVVAYFALGDERMEHLSALLFAYAANYAIGLVLYVLFIAHGPRNFDPTLFESLLYVDYPSSGYLTHTVNRPANVFPSLHASMAMTVFFLAWRTREEYPTWVPISGLLAISVALSTMYLGVHWFTDVVAGILLAIVSVYVGVNYTVEELLRGGSTVVVSGIDRVRTFLLARLDGVRTGNDGGESPRGD